MKIISVAVLTTPAAENAVQQCSTAGPCHIWYMHHATSVSSVVAGKSWRFQALAVMILLRLERTDVGTWTYEVHVLNGEQQQSYQVRCYVKVNIVRLFVDETFRHWRS